MFIHLLEIITVELPGTDEALLLALSTAACKAAVKAHDRLDEIEVKKLIADLILLETNGLYLGPQKYRKFFQYP